MVETETETEEEGTTAVGRSGNMGFAGQFMGFPAAWGVGWLEDM